LPTTFLYCALVRCGGQTHTGLMINFPFTWICPPYDLGLYLIFRAW